MEMTGWCCGNDRVSWKLQSVVEMTGCHGNGRVLWKWQLINVNEEKQQR